MTFMPNNMNTTFFKGFIKILKRMFFLSGECWSIIKYALLINMWTKNLLDVTRRLWIMN